MSPAISGRCQNLQYSVHFLCCFLLLLSLSSLRVSAQFIQAELCVSVCFCTEDTLLNCNLMDAVGGIPSNVAKKYVNVNIQYGQFGSLVIQRKNLTGLEHLTHLTVIYSKIRSIDTNAFIAMTKLRYLDLSNNNLGAIQKDTFYGLKLESLHIQNNPNIHLLTDSFRGLKTKQLYLRNNRLRSLKFEHFSGLDLESLYLSNNSIQTLDRRFGSLFDVPTKVLDLTANPLYCTCQLMWLNEVLKRQRSLPFAKNMNITCASPPNLKGRELRSLTSLEMPCPSPRIESISIDLRMPHAELICTASGYPTPGISWTYHRDASGIQEERRLPFENSMSKELFNVDDSPVKSRISLNVSVTPDKRSYICKTWNQDQKKQTVTVFLSGVPPSFLGVVPPPTRGDDRSGNSKVKEKFLQSMSTPTSNAKRDPEVYQDKHFIFRKQFTLLEMIGAVVGTFTVTLALLLGLTWFFTSRRKTTEKEKKTYWTTTVGSAYSAGTGSHEYDVPRIDHPPYPPPRRTNDIEFLDFKTQRLLYNPN